jgi:hypothetical protein
MRLAWVAAILLVVSLLILGLPRLRQLFQKKKTLKPFPAPPCDCVTGDALWGKPPHKQEDKQCFFFDFGVEVAQSTLGGSYLHYN